MDFSFEGDVSSYEWLQDGKKIRNTADFKQYCTDDGFACLTIDDVLYLEDSGMYTCQLEGPDGSIISCNILLDVRKGLSNHHKGSLRVLPAQRMTEISAANEEASLFCMNTMVL